MLKHYLSKTKWLYPLAGGLLGTVYVIIDEGILDQLVSPNSFVLVAHEFVDAILPVLLGIAAGFIIDFFRRELRLNKSLSLKKEKLERELLLSMLISQMLHEIQNPLHNISAAFENPEETITDEKYKVIRRNLDRLNELKKKYGHWEWPAQFDPEEALLFKPWLKTWLEDKMNYQLGAFGIHCITDVKDVKLFAHPVLVEQIFRTIFENAFESLEKSDKKRTLYVEAGPASDKTVQIRVSSNGSLFPEEVLLAQGNRPVHSRYGLGLGLLLLNKILEQIDGKMSLSNETERSVVSLLLPGKSA